MDRHRRSFLDGKDTSSEDASIWKAIDSLATSYADQYLSDVCLYNMEIEKSIKSNQQVLSDVKRSIKRIRASLFKTRSNSKCNTIKELRALQRDISVNLIKARAQHRLLLCTARTLLAKGKKNRGYDNPTLKQAMKRHDWAEWEIAINKEYQQLIDEGTFEECLLGDIPPGASIVGSMMVLTIKRDPTKPGEIDKYKARLVALGNQQKPSSYDDIKSGTARSASVKMLISLQAKLGSFSMVMDVKGAYLKSVVKDSSKQIYLRLPNKKIVKLKKYLYGLKQAGYEWKQNITSCLITLGYDQSETDPLVFSKWEDNGDHIIMCIHVDDFYVVASKEELLLQLHEDLVKQYGEVTSKEGDLLSYLGFKIDTDLNTGVILISQPAYIRKMVEKFLTADELKSKRSFRTPMRTVDLKQMIGDEILADVQGYLEMVGSLNYLAQFSRPDILFAVSVLAQKCSKPTNRDIRKAKRVFQYLRRTPDIGVSFGPGRVKLTCYADAAYNVYPDARSHIGYTFSLGKQDGSFYAKSRKTKLTALSSTEAEYVALCEACRDAVWLRRLLSDIGFPQNKPTLIWQDNKSTIDFVRGHRQHQASKHINPKFHYSGEMVAKGEICIEHISTKMMIADILTKALPSYDHDRLGNLLLNTDA
jgi:hypothetical protein